MTLFRLLWRNLLYHRRGNLAVLLGAAVGTAVLTGALLVGDSLRGSLRQQALEQLGWVEQALVTPRFFRADLASELPAEHSAPAILLQGTVTLADTGEGQSRRPAKAAVVGVDERFWHLGPLPGDAGLWRSDSAQVVLSAPLARALNVKAGDRISLNVQKADAIPRETIVGKRAGDEVLTALEVTVKEVLPEHGLGRFALKPSPEPALNAFVPLGFLQS